MTFARSVGCPAFVYAGSADERVARPLMEQGQRITAEGIELRIFNGLDHEGEMRERDEVLPSVLAFLHAARLDEWVSGVPG